MFITGTICLPLLSINIIFLTLLADAPESTISQTGFKQTSASGPSGLLTQLVKKNVSDVHLVLGEVPACRIDGKLIKTTMPPLTKEQLISISKQVLPKNAIEQLDTLFDYDFLYEIEGISRFRGNFARTSDAPSYVFRTVRMESRTRRGSVDANP